MLQKNKAQFLDKEPEVDQHGGGHKTQKTPRGENSRGRGTGKKEIDGP